MATPVQIAPTILRRRQVQARTGLSRSTLYEFIKTQAFPKPLQLGPRAVGWISTEVEEWLTGRERTRAQPEMRIRRQRACDRTSD